MKEEVRKFIDEYRSEVFVTHNPLPAGFMLTGDEMDLLYQLAAKFHCRTFTPDHQRIIKAMIRGVWECETCNARDTGSVYCLLHSINMIHPCFDWQERKVREE